MFIYLYILFIINLLLSNQKLCGPNEIPHCIECDDVQEICTKCENKYFVLFGGYRCISCNDEEYGEPACEGNCDGSRYSQIQTVLCDKCKEGYYNVEGFCIECSIGSDHCVKCSYEFSSESNKQIYTCLECVDGLNGEYRISKIDGKCRTCNKPPCSECYFEKGKLEDYVCTKCPNNYYLSNGRCNGCYYQSNVIEGGTCYNYYCPGGNHNMNNYCKCNLYYVLTTYNTCKSCPSNCLFEKYDKYYNLINRYYCYYDKNTDSAKCQICENRYILTDQGKCIFCPPDCNTCFYDKDTDSAKCETCYSNAILTNQNTCILCPTNCSTCFYDEKTDSVKCKSCHNNDVLTTAKTCISCPSNCNTCFYDEKTDSAKCKTCHKNEVLTTEKTCISCPSNCNSCSYDGNLNIAKCNSCNDYYTLSQNNECIFCGVGCIHCNLEDGEIKCISCIQGYILEDNQCTKLSVPQQCIGYISQRFNNTDEVICTKCNKIYALDSINNKCTHCPNYCRSCLFDDSNRIICDNCDIEYVLNETKLCECCTDNAAIGGVGCLHCKYQNGINNCSQCRNDYIHIDNDYVCKLPSEVNLNVGCINATRLENGEYTCKKCRNISYTMMIRYNNTNDCYPAENELVYCQKGYEDENKNLSCTKCLYNYRFIWSKEYQINICDNHCASDYFFNYDEDIRGCYKCDDESGGGQIGCNPKKGCIYIVVDNHIYCNSCKTGYFRFDWQCLTCSVRDSNCIECDFNNTEKNLNVINA